MRLSVAWCCRCLINDLMWQMRFFEDLWMCLILGVPGTPSRVRLIGVKHGIADWCQEGGVGVEVIQTVQGGCSRQM